MQFAEGIAHLVQHGDQVIMAVKAVIDAQRIKRIAEDSRQGEQINMSLWIKKIGALELCINPNADRLAIPVPMVRIEKAQEIKAIMRENPGLTGNIIQLIEIKI